MSAPLLLLALLASWPGPGPSSPWRGQEGFQGVLAKVGESRYEDARRAASGLPEGVERSQALVYVHYQAGDLAGALGAARTGLLAHPEDAYLLEQAARLALDLGEPDMALGWTQELERLAVDGDGREKAGVLGAEARSGLLLREGTAKALGRARLAVILGALLALLGAALSLGGPRSRPS